MGVFDRSLRCSKWPVELEVEYVVGDIADSESVQSAARQFEETLGGVHVICAPVSARASLDFHFGTSNRRIGRGCRR